MCIACKSVASLGIASALLLGCVADSQAADVTAAGIFARDACQYPDFQGGIRRGDAVYTISAAQGAAAV